MKKLSLPIKPTEDIETRKIPTIITDPTTPIPPAMQPCKPFFSGQMPLPPSVNDEYQVVPAWTINKAGQRTLKHRIGPSVALTSFKEQAAVTLMQAFIDHPQLEMIQESQRRHIKTPLAVKLNIYFATPWRRDLDGPIKYAIDAAFNQIGLNDNQLVHIDPIDKQVDAHNPRVEIEIRCMLTR